MNRIILSSLILLWSVFSVAQTTYYNGQLSNRHYQPLAKAVKLNAMAGNPDLFLLELKEAWRFFDEYTDDDTMTIGKNGFIITSGANFSMAIDPFLADLEVKSNAQSGIYLKWDTLSNPKKISVEWRDMELEGNPSTDYANFMVNLYSNQVIEFHYGICRGSDTTAFRGANGPQVVNTLLSKDFFTVYEFHVVHGNPAQPTFTPFPIPRNLDSVPPAGTVYRFEPFDLSEAENQGLAKLHVFPNPAQEEIRILGIESARAKIMDLSGRMVSEGPINGERLSVNHLKPGKYLLTITSDRGEQLGKTSFIKK